MSMPTPTIAYTIRDNLYLNITSACTLKCRFCPKHNGSWQVHDYDLSLQRNPTVQELIAAIGDPGRYREVVFCGYGEPTLRLNVVLEVADYIKSRGGKVRLNTDGLANLVYERNVLPELQGRIDALSVSMNATDPDVYERHCDPGLPGSFEAVVAFIEAATRYIPEVTATAIEGLPGVDIEACEKLAKCLGASFRRRQLGVVG